MNPIENNASEHLSKTQSLLVIKEMIQVSKNKFRQDGVLFIIWGWFLFFKSILGYVERKIVLTYQFKRVLNYVGIAIFILCLAFTVYYLLKQRKRVQTYIGISLRYVWISLFVCMVLVNLIQFNVTQNINFELQQPIFMVLMAFAVTVTGGILRYRLIIIGGVVFGVLALTASYLNLQDQLLVESIAWIIAFIVPGHILYAGREN
jgi:hypothetical protein